MMKYEVTSVGRGKKSTQVTVVVGEGANRRSFTRHLHRQGGALVGLNIDERAIPLNELYESELAEAKSNLAGAEATLKALQETLCKELGAVNLGGATRDEALLEDLRKAISLAQDDVDQATIDLDDAETKLNIVRRELPLIMEFTSIY